MSNATDATGASATDPTMRDKLIRLCRALVAHLADKGEALPTELAGAADELGKGSIATDRLVGLYNALAAKAAPAAPESILAIAEARRGGAIFGPYRTVTILLLLSVLLLFSFVVLGSSTAVNEKSLDEAFVNRVGLEQWASSLFLLAAAGLGAAFEGLFRAYYYITRRTYDPGYDASYYIRLIMGIFAGFLLADLVYGAVDLGKSELGKPVIALIGGFSAEAVHRILRRIAETLEAMVRGDLDARAQQRAAELQAKQRERQDAVNKKAMQSLLELKAELGASGGGAGVDAVDKIIADVATNWRA